MRTWLALLLAPTLALLDQGIALAMSDWACSRQAGLAIQGVHFAFLLAVLASAFMAWGMWRETASGAADDESGARRHFLAGVATASGALSALVIAAMWLPTWALSPCFG